ncbi:hypothetical protein OAK75_12725 [Bacteriovoracales bacterium]|nr:hypothetical protein [Bacteriovoracales bacterium]
MLKNVNAIYKTTLTAIFFIFSVFGYGSNLKSFNWSLSPSQPVQNKEFSISFKFVHIGNSQPKISFELDRCELLNLTKVLIASDKKIINDRFIITKRYEYKYKFKSKSVGRFKVRNLKVLDGVKEKKLKSFSFFIKKVKKPLLEYFFVASTNKLKYFRGEGFDVNYYLYYRGYILGTRIIQFPKLNGFMKRYKKIIDSNDELAQFRGGVYKRRAIYSARLFGTELGHNFLDGMKLSIDHPQRKKNGFNNDLYVGKIQTKTLSSEPIKIKIISTPLKGKNNNFTYLVGRHSIKFNLLEGERKVNNPISFNFQIEGSGAIENFDPPSFFDDPNVEYFSSRSTFTESKNRNTSKKQFFYTIMTKKPLEIKKREITFSFFDPKKEKYEIQKLKIPSLYIEGPNLKKMPQNRLPSSVEKNQNKIIFNDKYIAPTFKPTLVQYFTGQKVNILLCSVLLLLLLELLFSKKSAVKSDIDEELKAILKDAKKGKLNYSKLFKLIQRLNREDGNQGVLSPRSIIKNCKLNIETKKYFESLLEIFEHSAFGVHGAKKQFKYEKKCFKELERNILETK